VSGFPFWVLARKEIVEWEGGLLLGFVELLDGPADERGAERGFLPCPGALVSGAKP